MTRTPKKNIFNFITLLFLTVTGITSLYSQENDINNLFLRANLLINHNPDESIKISDYLTNRNLSEDERDKAVLIKTKSYLAKNDLNNAVLTVFDIKTNTAELLFEVQLIKAKIAKKLYLDNQFHYYITLAEELISTPTFTNKTQEKKNLLIIEKTEYLIERHKISEGVKFIEKGIIDQDSAVPDIKDYIHFLSLYATENTDEKINAIETFIANQYTKEYPNKLLLAKFHIELGKQFFLKNDYKLAIASYQKAMENAESLNNLSLLQISNYEISLCYLTIQDIENYNKYNNSFLDYNNHIQNAETQVVNSYFSKYDDEIKYLISNEYNIYKTKFNWVLILVSLITIAFSVILIRKKIEQKKLKEIVSYLELYNNAIKVSIKSTTAKKSNIPIDTENLILSKLKKFESSKKYTHKEMSLANLASQFDTNTKYLSEVINKHYGMNFNSYINTLRVNFIIDKLKSNHEYLNYKISYLAEISGFSSHSLFATVFKSITGIAPTTFIELLKKEVKEI